MKLVFLWEESADGLYPSCNSSVVNECGVSPLACLLVDDGGQRYLDTVHWLEEGVRRIRSVKYLEVDLTDWSREAWGVELSIGQAKIYSLYDDNCFEIVSLDAFEIALVAWKIFIQITPKRDAVQTLEI
jgi:hypothetical protein